MIRAKTTGSTGRSTTSVCITEVAVGEADPFLVVNGRETSSYSERRGRCENKTRMATVVAKSRIIKGRRGHVGKGRRPSDVNRNDVTWSSSELSGCRGRRGVKEREDEDIEISKNTRSRPKKNRMREEALHESLAPKHL